MNIPQYTSSVVHMSLLYLIRRVRITSSSFLHAGLDPTTTLFPRQDLDGLFKVAFLTVRDRLCIALHTTSMQI